MCVYERDGGRVTGESSRGRKTDEKAGGCSEQDRWHHGHNNPGNRVICSDEEGPWPVLRRE